MPNDDAKLIQHVLGGDDTAFSTVVRNTKNEFMHLRGVKLAISTRLFLPPLDKFRIYTELI